MCVLYIVNRVLGRFFYCKVKVKVQSGVWLTHVEEETCSIDWNQIGQVRQGDGFTGTFAHAVWLAVLHQTNQLHQNDVQLAAIQTDCIHRTFQSCNMAVMVCTPYVDYAVKVTVSKFVLVVSNVSGKVGWVAVCTDQNFVLFSAKFGCLVPNCTIFFIGQSTFGQIIHNCFYCTGLMQSAFREPYIVNDAVFFQVGSELFNVLWQSKVNQSLTAFLLRNI